MEDPQTIVTQGSTYDNKSNLAKSFFSSIITQYEGTRIGRQELNAELLEDMPGALWKRNDIDEHRKSANSLPDMERVVVAVDPSVTNKEGSDETGIICGGRGTDGHAYVWNDSSKRMSPSEWGKIAVSLFHSESADVIVAESNNGGDMVEDTIRTVEPNVNVKQVRASRGKVTRAEPVAALYEQGRVHHVGSLDILEDQMVNFTSDFDRSKQGYSPDRVDALVWMITELFPSMTKRNRERKQSVIPKKAGYF
jgi:phage terminase large subunit-like protein